MFQNVLKRWSTLRLIASVICPMPLRHPFFRALGVYRGPGAVLGEVRTLPIPCEVSTTSSGSMACVCCWGYRLPPGPRGVIGTYVIAPSPGRGDVDRQRAPGRHPQLLRQAQVPVVETWDIPEDPIEQSVGFSNVAAAAALFEHLYDRGYRRMVTSVAHRDSIIGVSNVSKVIFRPSPRWAPESHAWWSMASHRLP